MSDYIHFRGTYRDKDEYGNRDGKYKCYFIRYDKAKEITDLEIRLEDSSVWIPFFTGRSDSIMEDYGMYVALKK